MFYFGEYLVFFILGVVLGLYICGFAKDHCLDSGKGVWDYNERRCRTDCWKWDDKLGCLKE